MASEWYDYNEYSNYLYKLWKSGEWDRLDPSIKRFLWNEKQKLYDEANADMEEGIDYPDAFTPEEYIIQQETYQELYAAIDTLDEVDKDIINLYYFEELSERKVEKVLNITQGTVNNHKAKSLKKIKEIMEKKQ